MRLKISLRVQNERFTLPNKHAVQGFIYNMLKDTEYGLRHDQTSFKFFTFSDFSQENGYWIFFVSSPDPGFIRALYSNIKEKESVYIGKHELSPAELKMFKLPLRRAFQTGSPVVLYWNAEEDEYFKLHQHRDLRFFLGRLKENAEKKYEAFYSEDIALDGPVLDRVIPKLRKNGKLDVYVRVVKNEKPFPVIGSNWEPLEKDKIKPEGRKFYRFIMDAGLKKSLGFGFINPLRR